MSAVGVSESGVRPILAEAVELARRALLDLEPIGVGAHLGVTAEDESSATHHFKATLPGYHGWQWAVVVAAPPEATVATVSESALLPGPDALVAPDFIPWEQRIRPGDLAPGDLLAPPLGDPRLVPGYMVTGDPAVDDVALELGLGRTQALSREGREEAGDRWFSEYGPDTEMARAAPSTCGLCGFYVPLAGALRAAFGVCANAMGADGHVVHIAYGCGAHSDVVLPSGNGSPLYEAYDDAAVDLIPISELRPETAAPAPESADTDESGTESAEVAADTESAIAAETAVVADEPVAVNDSQTVAAEAEAAVAVDETSAVADETSAVADETSAVADETSAMVDEVAPVVAPETSVDEGVTGLFAVPDPDAVYDDAWAVTAVRVEPDSGASEAR